MAVVGSEVSPLGGKLFTQPGIYILAIKKTPERLRKLELYPTIIQRVHYCYLCHLIGRNIRSRPTKFNEAKGLGSQNWNRIEPNRSVTYMVLKAAFDDRRKSLIPFHDEFHGLRSDSDDLVSLEATTLKEYSDLQLL
ncbi:hypothetical protein TNCV_4987051 [Trichonephila clavipes]|nr:hypothetical protein TNCV_4987051 [Trichonephila clavipes]